MSGIVCIIGWILRKLLLFYFCANSASIDGDEVWSRLKKGLVLGNHCVLKLDMSFLIIAYFHGIL